MKGKRMMESAVEVVCAMSAKSGIFSLKSRLEDIALADLFFCFPRAMVSISCAVNQSASSKNLNYSSTCGPQS